MESEQIYQLDSDLRSSTQVVVFGPKQENGGHKGFWMAPRQLGWHVSVDSTTMEVVAHRTSTNENYRTRPIKDVGEIYIYVEDQESPSIFWRRDGDGNLVRETY
jgi:hypothetical protein